MVKVNVRIPHIGNRLTSSRPVCVQPINPCQRRRVCSCRITCIVIRLLDSRGTCNLQRCGTPVGTQCMRSQTRIWCDGSGTTYSWYTCAEWTYINCRRASLTDMLCVSNSWTRFALAFPRTLLYICNTRSPVIRHTLRINVATNIWHNCTEHVCQCNRCASICEIGQHLHRTCLHTVPQRSAASRASNTKRNAHVSHDVH